MWTTQPATFEGKYYAIHDAYCSPQPSPTIPILIGGGGEQRTLAVVARYADWWNVSWTGIDTYRTYVEEFERACSEVQRDPATVRRVMRW